LDSIIENFLAAAQLEEARSPASFLNDQMAAARVEADLQVSLEHFRENFEPQGRYICFQEHFG
jgi:hypothetical protein